MNAYTLDQLVTWLRTLSGRDVRAIVEVDGQRYEFRVKGTSLPAMPDTTSAPSTPPIVPFHIQPIAPMFGLPKMPGEK